MEETMTDYQISLSGGGQIARTLNARCDDDHEACALAQRMINAKGQADVWANSRHVGWVSAISATGIEAISRPWSVRPPNWS
jgi:hypothetical protein